MSYKNYWFCLALIAFVFSSCDPEEQVTDITQFPRVKVYDNSALEDSGQLKVQVELTWAYTQEVTVDYETIPLENLSADPVNDYTSVSGRVVFAPGETVQEISVPLLEDVVSEADEKFQLILSEPIFAKLLVGTATLTILDDDGEFFVDDTGFEAPEEYLNMTRVWEDDFEGNSLDDSNWTHEMGGNGWGNNELQNYTDRVANSFVAGGYLVIEAKDETYNGNEYTSARIVSQDKYEFQYGRVDFRARVPEGRGIWPALWMLGADFSDVGWPHCGEIDIMEVIGQQAQISHGTAHFPNTSGAAKFKGNSTFLSGGKKFSDEFHVYSIVWFEDYIEWQVDGVKFHSLTPADLEDVDGVWSYNHSFFFIMNVAVGGNWPGSPNETTIFPARMIIDYVRVYQNQ